MIRQIMRETMKKVIPHFYFLDIQVFTFIGESVIIKRIDITLDHNRGDNMKINEELAEKPDHQHYPACLGRKMEIEKQCFDIFVYTGIICIAFIIFSIAGARFTVPYAIPEMLCGTNTLGAAFLQCLEFLLLAAASFFGCFKYKIADVFVMLTYLVTLVVTILAKEYVTDIFVIILSAWGLWKSRGAFSIMNDYEQIRNTEGFPLFSLILIEQEKKKNNGMDPSVFRNNSGSDDMDNAVSVAAPVFSGDADGMDMPSIAPVKVPDYNYDMKRYMPQGKKVSGILESPMRTR